MKKLIVTVFIILLIVSGKADAVTLSNQALAERIKRDVTEQIRTIVPGRIVVDVKTLPYQKIEIPSGQLKINVSINQRFFTQSAITRVQIIVDDKEIKSFGVPVKIQVWDKVWVATDTIYRGETFSASNIKLEEKEISLIAEKAAREDVSLEGNLVKKSFAPGEIIDKRFVESVPTVMKNNQVSLIFKTSTITVNLPGEALDNGKMGDYIRVRNQNYKKEYIGKVIGANAVLVNL